MTDNTFGDLSPDKETFDHTDVQEGSMEITEDSFEDIDSDMAHLSLEEMIERGNNET